ncbi:unnamed protein product [Calypogeia fissa]
MASISISCTSAPVPTLHSCADHTVASSQQSVPTQCISRRFPGGGFVARRGFADGLLCQSSKKRVVGGHSRKSQQHDNHQQKQLCRVNAGLKETALTEEKWGPPITLGTAQLPKDVDLNKLETLLFQWGASLTQNANLPLPVPLKVDRIEGGVRLGYIRVIDGKVEDLVHIDVIVTPPNEEQPKAIFRAIRNGEMKGSVPPGEPAIMQSLLAALKMSIPLARTSV